MVSLRVWCVSWPLRVMMLVLVAVSVGGGVLAAPVQAEEPCANEQLRERSVYALGLPDCRAYEQVTPVQKDGTNPSGGTDLVQASPLGDRISFVVLADMPGATGTATFPLFLASRSESEGWSSQGLLLPTPPGGSAEVAGWSEDLSETVSFAQLAGDSARSLYLRGSVSGVYQRVVPGSGFEVMYPAGFSADRSQLIFETDEPLLPNAAPGKTNLYELNNGALSLAGVLSDAECAALSLPSGCAPPAGSFAGPYNWQASFSQTQSGGATRGYYTAGTISSDGSRVFFTAGGTGQLYVRENGATTIRVSASQRTVSDPSGPKPAAFMAATPDGSKVFFTSCEKLTNDSTAVSTGASSCTEGAQGQDLYEYDLGSGALLDLTVDSNAGDAHGAAVQGVLGVSADGSYVYFVANGVLPSTSGASSGSCRPSERSTGTCNLYVWHEGMVSFIARLNASGIEEQTDSQNWKEASKEGNEKTSRVTPDGRTLLFRSQQKLTGYDNHGLTELYLYRYNSVTSGSPICVSCNPSGAAPSGGVELDSPNSEIEPSRPASSLTRNLSADGNRVFFTTNDGLVPQDVNGTSDVYEWEKEGTGSCQGSSASFSESSGGCLYLISTGRSPDPSYFADASATGDDAFFFTGQSLVAQDQDGNVDIYDARVDGGIASQSLSPELPCVSEECRGTFSPSPLFGAPSSMTLSGSGNLPPAVPPAVVKPKPKPKPVKCKRGFTTKHNKCVCKRGFTKKHNKCVRAKKSKKAKKAGHNRRASR